MVDFILLCFVIGVFAGGFWCGKTYQTFGKMIEAVTAFFK